MEDYKPNSHKFKEEQKALPLETKKIEKVVSNTAKTKKKSELTKLKDVFIAEDVSNVKTYIVRDVLIPAAKKAVYDIITNGIDMILYGGSGRGKSKSTVDKVSYRSYYDSPKDRFSSSETKINRGFEYDDIIFESRGEAEAARIQMNEIIDRYGVVTVADLYDMADLSAPYTSNKYGWTSVRNVEIGRVRDGYVLKLSRAMPID